MPCGGNRLVREKLKYRQPEQVKTGMFQTLGAGQLFLVKIKYD